MNIGITGGNGFVGWHLQCYLKTRKDISNVEVADRKIFDDDQRLREFVKNKDVIFHLAGVNRANSDVEISDGNKIPATKLKRALEEEKVDPVIIYSSTTHALTKSTIYGEAKAAVSEILAEWAKQHNARFINVIVPHVFGEYCKPNYNSVIATFCHQIANKIEPSITGNAQLELVHVQDLVEELMSAYENETKGLLRIKGTPISVLEVADKLKSMFQLYQNGITPDLSSAFERALFNSLRAAIPMEQRLKTPKLHIDDRGWLVETIKANSGGQSFVSSTKQGVTRGNHFHRRKYERFFILRGSASVKMRKVGTEDISEYKIDSNHPGFIDIPTLYTHNITNIGDEELITFFWTDELYDPENPDTYFELVQ